MLNVPYITSIEGPMHPGSFLRIEGEALPIASCISLNLQCGPNLFPRSDIALHMSVDFAEQCVVRNSFIQSSWGPEENHGPFFFERGGHFDIVLACHHDSIKIKNNGVEYVVFQHRVPYERITHLSIEGHVKLYRVSYNKCHSDYGFRTSEMSPAVARDPRSLYYGVRRLPGTYQRPLDPVPAYMGVTGQFASTSSYQPAPGYPTSASGYPAPAHGYPAPGPGYPAASYPAASYPTASYHAASYPAPGYPAPCLPYPTNSSQACGYSQHYYPRQPPQIVYMPDHGVPPRPGQCHPTYPTQPKKPTIMEKALSLTGVAAGTGALSGALHGKGGTLKGIKKKALKYGLPMAGVGIGAYGVKKAFSISHSSSSSSSSSSD